MSAPPPTGFQFCKPSYPGQLTNIASDWHDIDAVVDYIRTLRKVEKVSVVAWSLSSASLQWLTAGALGETRTGVVKLGD